MTHSLFLIPAFLLLFLFPSMEFVWFTLCLVSGCIGWLFSHQYWSTRRKLENAAWECAFKHQDNFMNRLVKMKLDAEAESKPSESAS